MLNKIKTKGFTMLEVMVAIFVITIGVLAAFNVAQNITMFSKVNSSRLTATYLAQEGIELVRNQRDSSWVEEINTGIPHDWGQNKLVLATLIGSESLGKFTRETDIDDQGTFIIVSVTVSWEEGGTTYLVTDQTELYNWIQL